MSGTATFNNYQLDLIDLDGQRWLNALQIVTALEVSELSIRVIFNRNKDRFTPDMTTLIELPTASGPKLRRIYSLRGSRLLAMLSRGPNAEAFQNWLLDLAEAEDRRSQPASAAAGHPAYPPPAISSCWRARMRGSTYGAQRQAGDGGRGGGLAQAAQAAA